MEGEATVPVGGREGEEEGEERLHFDIMTVSQQTGYFLGPPLQSTGNIHISERSSDPWWERCHHPTNLGIRGEPQLVP